MDHTSVNRMMRLHSRQVCGDLQRTGRVTELLPHVINMMASPDIVIKKLCYGAYTRHAHRAPTEALLAVNTILKDSHHHSPVVRSLVLTSIAPLTHQLTGGIRTKIVQEGLRDTSSFVRRHAVLCEAPAERDEVYIHPSVFDPDPLVSIFALTMSSKVSSDQTTIYKLLNVISSQTDEGICKVMKILGDYTPNDKQQCLDIMSAIDPCLDSSCLSVGLATMDVFCKFSINVDDTVAADIQSRLRDCCLAHLRSVNHSIIYGILLWLEEKFQLEVSCLTTALFREHYPLFLCHSLSPNYVNTMKIQVLPHLVDESNISEILGNLEETLGKSTTIMSKQIAETLHSIHVQFPTQTLPIVENIFSSSDIAVICRMFAYLVHFEEILDKLGSTLTFKVLDKWKSLSEDSLVILFHLASQFAHTRPESQDILKDITIHSLDSNSLGYKLEIAAITCIFKCFIIQPAEYASLLKDCMNFCQDKQSYSLKGLYNWMLAQIKLLLSAP